MMKYVCVQTRYEAIHFYPDAPDEVAFLRNLHRHEFQVNVTMEVFHGNRDVELILLKRFLNDTINASIPKTSDISCEVMASLIADALRDKYGPARWLQVQVLEDGENGALVIDEGIKE